MIRATVLRALVLTAAFAAALTPVTCLGENSNRLPTKATKLPAKATKNLPPELLSLLRQKKMPKHSPILVRVFKEEAELEVWKQDTTGSFQILKTYPICRWSGDLGPKLREGDRQTPEGFYRVTPELMNPHSNYYLSINIGYPNSFDKANNRDGSLIMIHGDCWSSWLPCHDRRTDQRDLCARARVIPGRPAVIPGPGLSVPHDAGESGAASKQSELGRSGRCSRSATITSRRRISNPRWMCATAAMYSMRNVPRIHRKPLVFNPTGKCPAFVVNPKIAQRALEKQRADELEYAQLLEDNVPAAPIYSELDGGMNEVFLARFPDRVTLSKKIGLDLAQHPVELLMGAHQRMHALEALDIAVPAARRADEGIE